MEDSLDVIEKQFYDLCSVSSLFESRMVILPREQIPYIDEPDGRAYYEELLAMRDAYGMAAFNLLEDEPDPESDRGWEHEALNMIHMG